MKELKNFQKKYLKALAHSLKPVVFLGQNGVTVNFIESVNQALEKHELIKIKFIDYKEKEFKTQISETIVNDTKAFFVSIIGNTLILYRKSKDEKNQKINLPQNK
ncbi:MAG: ribosome assembly RNA-binding protein YhbY [Desulfobacteraceae bacterium]|nr:ribosome assembly RNA-binding protein YhbY [Desulfobacteraceae bacterium]